MYDVQRVKCIESLKMLIEINSLDYRILSEDDICDICIISKDSNPVAIVQFSSDFSYINWFEVFPQYRKQNMGKQIVNYILSELISINKMDTICVVPLDENIETFWSKCGFSKSDGNSIMFYNLKSYIV